MKKLHYTLLALLLISINSFAQDFQYYIYERYYNYSDNIRPSAYAAPHSYLQGPMLEEAINRNLKSDIKKCESGINSKYILSIKPNTFYNYQMNILYGELKVKVFGPKNVLKDTLTVEVKYQGKIHQKADFYISKLYDELIKKLGTDILNKLPKNNLTINGNFCTTIELSKPKPNIDKNYKKQIQA